MSYSFLYFIHSVFQAFVYSQYKRSYIPTIIHRTEKYKKHIAHSTHIIKRCYRVICTGKTENMYEYNDFPFAPYKTGVNVTSIWLCFAEFSLQFEIKPIGFVVSSLLVFKLIFFECLGTDKNIKRVLIPSRSMMNSK